MMTLYSPVLPDQRNIDQAVAFALHEDLGEGGDITGALIPPETTAQAHVLCREPMVLCGQAWVESVLKHIDPGIEHHWLVNETDYLPANTTLLTLTGHARSLLAAERCLLNFLQTLSGIATTTHLYVAHLKGCNTQVLDTRKTLPGFRVAQKYAVHCGGGGNHRFGLFDAFLIKENHLSASACDIRTLVIKAYESNPVVPLMVEVETLEQLEQLLDTPVSRVMLDNFSLRGIQRAVKMVNRRIDLEVSGGITCENIREIAETGVPYISVGALTKNIQAIDLSMVFKHDV